MGLFNAVQAYLKVLSECHPQAAPDKEKRKTSSKEVWSSAFRRFGLARRKAG